MVATEWHLTFQNLITALYFTILRTDTKIMEASAALGMYLNSFVATARASMTTEPWQGSGWCNISAYETRYGVIDTISSYRENLTSAGHNTTGGIDSSP